MISQLRNIQKFRLFLFNFISYINERHKVLPVPAAKSSHLRRGGAMVALEPPLTEPTPRHNMLLTPGSGVTAAGGNESSEFLSLRSNNA